MKAVQDIVLFFAGLVYGVILVWFTHEGLDRVFCVSTDYCKSAQPVYKNIPLVIAMLLPSFTAILFTLLNDRNSSIIAVVCLLFITAFAISMAFTS